MSSALEKEPNLNESTIDDIKHVAASMYGGIELCAFFLWSSSLYAFVGGSDTTVSSQYAFFLAMLLNPGEPFIVYEAACSH